MRRAGGLSGNGPTCANQIPTDGDPCGAGLFCFASGTCSSGSCNAAPRDCSDQNPCTTDGCNEAADSCTHADNTLSCNDGDDCTGEDSCSAGTCSGTLKPECTTTTTTLLEILCGDANDDGVVTAGDALMALRTAVGTASCEPERCDFNGDSSITAGDALAILRVAVNLASTPKCPEADGM